MMHTDFTKEELNQILSELMYPSDIFEKVAKMIDNYCEHQDATCLTVTELIDLLPAVIDTKKDEPFNNYWLQIKKRSALNIQYIVRYVCDTYTAEEISSPIYERILHKTHSQYLDEAISEMIKFLRDEGFM